ncbi:MAG: DUF4398 domain-containing protein [Sideroxyarcus sp.]|nr:DUF4398 domain-containing protein [Sideroxyarcus sp.]
MRDNEQLQARPLRHESVGTQRGDLCGNRRRCIGFLSVFNLMDGKTMKKLNTPGSHHVMRVIGASVAAAFLLAACSSVSPPIEQMAVSRAAVNTASNAGATEFAPVLLKSAMDKMAAAELAMTRKEYVKAGELAEQAQVDAQLAAASSRSAKAQKAAETVQEDSRVLRKEIDRQSK